jgi:hypothetical protein
LADIREAISKLDFIEYARRKSQGGVGVVRFLLRI